MVWYQMWRHTEGGRDTDDDALALKLLGDVDLVARRGLDELDVGDGIANLDIGTGRRLEGTGSAKGARGGCRESAGGEHDDCCVCVCGESVDGNDLGLAECSRLVLSDEDVLICPIALERRLAGS
jgi:hypothetical protein